MQSKTPSRIIIVSGAGDHVASGLLADGGHLVETVATAQAAAQKLAHEAYDLALLGSPAGQDVAGVTELAALQKNGRPVIAAFAESHELAAGYGAGVSAFLTLPPDGAQLEQTLRGLSLFSGAVFDWDTALANMGMMEIVQEIIKVFLTEAPALLESVRTAMKEGGLTDIARNAHRFAGGIVVFGDIPCVQAARGLEKAAESGGSVSDYWFWLEQSYNRLYATLSQAA